MGKINIYSTNGTNKASLDYTGTSDITVDAEHLAGTTSNVQTQLDNKLSLTGGTLATDTITNASGNLTIASTQSILLKFDSDNDQTNREFNLQNNTGDQILKVKENSSHEEVIKYINLNSGLVALRFKFSISVPY